MNRRLLKWIGWSAAVAGVLALAWSALPYVVNVQGYKPAMVEAVRVATGRELVIDGPIELSMYPVPGVSARQVHFANAAGTTGAQMLDVGRVVVRPSLLALLQGRLEVGRLVLIRPNIVLEADADGKPNWEFTPGAGASQPAGAPAAGFHLAIGRLAIIRGTLTYTDPRTHKTIVAEDMRLQASVGSLQGPLTIAGTATVNGVPLKLDLAMGERTPEGNDLSVLLEVASGKLDFAGHVSDFGPNARVKGHLSVVTGLLTDFIAALVTASGQEKLAFDSSVVGRFAFDGGVEMSPERLAITDFKMGIGEEMATGSLALTEKPAPHLDGHVSLARVDLEKWLALVAQPGLLSLSKPAPPTAAGKTTPAPAPSAPVPSAPAPSAAAKTPASPATTPAAKPDAKPPAKPAVKAPAPAALSPFPLELAVTVALDVKELVYRKGTIRDLSVAVDIRKGVIALPHVQALLPGDMMLRANSAGTGDPAKPFANGEFSLSAPKLRETLKWLEIDVSGVPAGRLQTLSGNGTFTSGADKVQVGEAIFALDGVSATGSGSLTLGTPVTAALQIQIDRFDLDSYLPPPVTGLEAAVPPPPLDTTPPAPPAASVAVNQTAPSIGLKAKIGSLVFRGQPLKGIEADMTAQGGLIKVNSLKLADLLGAKADLRGQVRDLGTEPRFDVTFNATAPDADRVLDYAALPKFINGKIGAASASGGLAGTLGALSLNNVAISLLGATAHATGALVLGDKYRFDFPTFAFEAADASRLVSVAAGRDQGGVGAISASGSFKGDAKRVSFDGTMKAIGNELTGSIVTTLDARPTITAELKVPGTLDLDAWLGVSSAPSNGASAAPAGAATSGEAPTQVPIGPPRVASGKAIDLSALRSFDASLTLYTSAIAVGALRVNYGDLAATLKNGVFNISKLTGQFYSGAVDFTGTVDATKATLALDMKGSLQGIYLGEMLRGTAGTNIFGSDSLSVSVDGKLSIMDIDLAAHGDTPQAIRDSLTGRGAVSGVLYPAVAKGSLSLASFATGVGSLFSSEMGFSSAVLQGFINQQNKIVGEIQLGDGLVTLRDHTVQGQNAVALITSYNSFVAATTDTTISIDTGARGPAEFVMTVKGPISAPAMTMGRGPGR